ncbi:MAG: dTDP-glucose 4,6-dehydratase [Thermoleophilia bacterium]|nr:dTDP-glucose 4,6-dehydratase [Thermoleophilia bacterium]
MASMRILVTGGAGFIGSHFIHVALEQLPDVEIVNLDLMTYAANPANVADIADDPRYTFIQGDIGDSEVVTKAMQGVTHVANFAAESHVDRSIHGARDFIMTDVLGTYVLCQAAKAAGVERYLQVSTDEVYGSIDEGAFTETHPLNPSSPYSASKAGGDLQAFAYMHTFGLPVIVTRGSNTYGPNQYPEKLIPLFVTNALDGEKLPVYGDGGQIRDWIHGRDHAAGVLAALLNGTPGEVYNIGGGNERTNLWITKQILEQTGASDELITYVEDRLGHDVRYALDTTKAQRELGWKPEISFDQGLADTVKWYRDNRAWWEPIKSGEYRDFYEQQYAGRV